MRDGVPIGAIGVGRPEPGPFPQNQITLLQTFADQAVIAIENVRLFKELDARNRELTEALEQQTATSEILRVLSRSPTDAQPVFDTIAAAALKLCDASSANVFTFDGKLIHLAAHRRCSVPKRQKRYQRGFIRGRPIVASQLAGRSWRAASPPFTTCAGGPGLCAQAKSAARWGFRSHWAFR